MPGSHPQIFIGTTEALSSLYDEDAEEKKLGVSMQRVPGISKGTEECISG